MTNLIRGMIKLLGLVYLASILAACGGGATTTDNGSASTSVSSVSSAKGAVTLSWMPPTENTDGSPLTDLSGYVIYFGKSSDAMDSSITLDNSLLTSYMVDGLDANTVYYFAVTAVNSTNVQSNYSNIASTNVTG